MADELVKTEDRSEYTIGMRTAELLVGGKDETTGNKFVPNVNWSFHLVTPSKTEKYFLNLNMKDVVVDQEKEFLTDGEVHLDFDDFRLEFYKESAPEIDKAAVFRSEVVWKTKPLSNIIEWDIKSSPELKWLYQPPLDEQFDLMGGEAVLGMTREEWLKQSSQAPDVSGSYAIKVPERGVAKDPQGNVLQAPKTGRVATIFRSLAVDAELKQAWGELEVVYKDGQPSILREIFPQDFLDSAVYPIRVDAVLGDNVCGSMAGLGAGTHADQFQAGEDGSAITDIGSCSDNGDDGGAQTLTMSVYEDEGGGNDTQLAAEVTRTLAAGESDCDDEIGDTETYNVADHPVNTTVYWIAWERGDWQVNICHTFNAGGNAATAGAGHPAVDWSSLGSLNSDMDVWFEYTVGAAAIAPTAALDGPLVGPLGGPI